MVVLLVLLLVVLLQGGRQGVVLLRVGRVVMVRVVVQRGVDGDSGSGHSERRAEEEAEREERRLGEG